MNVRRVVWTSGLLSIMTLVLLVNHAHAASGRLGLHALRLEPNGEAEDLSDPSWGGGAQIVVVEPGLTGLVGLDFGIEVVNFNSETIVDRGGPFG